jgi:hypothetical protein
LGKGKRFTYSVLVASLVLDFDISGDNSITICNKRSIIHLVDMRQLVIDVVIEGIDVVLLGLVPLLDGGVSCLLSKQRTLPSSLAL